MKRFRAFIFSRMEDFGGDAVSKSMDITAFFSTNPLVVSLSVGTITDFPLLMASERLLITSFSASQSSMTDRKKISLKFRQNIHRKKNKERSTLNREWFPFLFKYQSVETKNNLYDHYPPKSQRFRGFCTPLSLWVRDSIKERPKVIITLQSITDFLKLINEQNQLRKLS